MPQSITLQFTSHARYRKAVAHLMHHPKYEIMTRGKIGDSAYYVTFERRHIKYHAYGPWPMPNHQWFIGKENRRRVI